jgi:ribulose-phosphate 3-epimerase
MVGSLGVAAAVALNPATPAVAVAHVLDLVDLVLVMTVNPGFGGQRYIATMEPKITDVRAMVAASGRDIDIEVDGGIDATTVSRAAAAGANVLVAGTALFTHPAGLAAAVKELRSRAEAAFV